MTTNDGLVNLIADEKFSERVRLFTEFFDEDYGSSRYKMLITDMLKEGRRRLVVTIDDLRNYNPELAVGLLCSPTEFLPPFDKALQNICSSLNYSSKTEDEQKPFYIGLNGSFGENELRPCQLNAANVGKMIAVEGIVSRCSVVRPKVVKSVHFCEATEMFLSREYRDATNMANALPTGSVYPREDDDGNLLTTEFGYSIYRDYQTLSLQEMPERASTGQLPRPIDVILDDDLVDTVKPGDRVRLIGVYRSIGKSAASVSAVFKTIIFAINIQILTKEFNNSAIEESDIESIRKIGRRKDVFELLSRSLAPSIYGHEFIKRALLLLMLGGVEKNLLNGTHLRGDINMLLIGDPSTAKSQMLRFVLNTAALAIATTGRGSSGVGLTAAVVMDKDTGERTLEAGAMVLADRGIVCIDEFDKMSDIDRVAIHEVMEQQTVTISKAGIHTSLNARCSVLAAANPAFGQYLDERKPFENISLPDSILSRFDLVFIVLDRMDEEFNRSISEHITNLHRSNVFEESSMGQQDYRYVSKDNTSEKSIFQRSGKGKATKNDVLTISFLKKYIQFAKTNISPVLSQEASDFISAKYSELRSAEDGDQDKYRTMPITPRMLETLIRLSTAHAKARLSEKVELVDAEVAQEILIFALYKEVKNERREKRSKKVENDVDSSDDSSDESVAKEPAKGTREDPGKLTREEPGKPTRDDLFNTFKVKLHVIRQQVLETNTDEPALPLAELIKRLRQDSSLFESNQIKDWVKILSDENRGIWYQSDTDTVIFV